MESLRQCHFKQRYEWNGYNVVAGGLTDATAAGRMVFWVYQLMLLVGE
jgi:hypothetical protein